jgi:hypothetical protein
VFLLYEENNERAHPIHPRPLSVPEEGNANLFKLGIFTYVSREMNTKLKAKKNMNPNQCPISESRETNTILVLLEQHATYAFCCSWFSSLKL